MIRVACLLVIAPLTAAAGAWDVFEQYCLQPMEQIAGFDKAGLAPDHAADAALTLNDDPSGRRSCEVRALREEPAIVANQFLAWSASPQNINRYVEVEGDPEVLTLRSVEWREPQLEVAMQFVDDGIVLSAKDTDLES